MAQQQNVEALRKQLQVFQQQLNMLEEKKSDECKMQYKGKNTKVKLIISNKQFITNTDFLFAKQHGNTLFIQTFLNKDQAQEGINDVDKSGKSQAKQSLIHLEFQRNPDLFQYIIDYLSGYNLQHQLQELTVIQLEKLQNDASYYQIDPFYNIVTSALHCRFNPYLGSALIELKKNSTVAIRSSINSDVWQSNAIYGILTGTATRYVEVYTPTAISRNFFLGVTEADSFKVGEYPGYNTVAGCGYHFNDGSLYRSGSYESWGSAVYHYERLGVMVKLNKESNMATIGFYKNGKLINKEMNLKNYMNVDKGVVFAVSIYSATDHIQLVQNPVIPQ
eukprot:451589_1